MTINTDVTIKELADKLGISKQAVRRYFDQLPPSLIPTKTMLIPSLTLMLTPLKKRKYNCFRKKLSMTRMNK